VGGRDGQLDPGLAPEPGKLPPEPGKLRLRTVALGAAVIIVIGGGVATWQLLPSGTPQPGPTHTPRATSTPGKPACPPTCVTDGSLVFDPGSAAMAAVEGAIAKENAQVRKNGHYVSVALLDPFTYSNSGDVSLDRMVDEMRGAYLAQLAANADNLIGVQLLLVNEGTTAEELQGTAVRQIEAREGRDHIVAVAGLGISTTVSESAARALAGDNMAMFGALPTADQFNSRNFPGYDQVTPNVSDQAAVLASVLPGLSSAVLICDQQANDLYTQDEQGDFQADDKRLRVNLYPYTPHTPSTNGQFATIAQNVCDVPGTPPDVFYAGRVSTLSALIAQFQQSTGCTGKRVTLVTTGDADGLDPAVTVTPPTDTGAQVSIEYTDIENANELTRPYQASYREYLAAVDPRQAGMSDPWTIATYDSGMAAWEAIASVYEQPSHALPTKGGVQSLTGLLNRKHAPVSATSPGFLLISAYGQLLAPDVPVFLDARGHRRTLRN